MSLIVVEDDSSDEIAAVSDGEEVKDVQDDIKRKPGQEVALTMNERSYDDAETVGTANSNDDEDKPLLELMKHLINSKQKIKITNSQLIDILKKEFGLDHANLHFISVDIYMNVLKKLLKIWPQWDEFDQIMHETRCMDDHEEFERMLDIEYTSLKEYLATMLKATKPFAKEAQKLKRSREIPESSKSVPGDVDGEMENDDEDKPLLELMKHLINSKQKIKITNSQLIDILKKEFGLDHANLHFISVDIYMNVLKKLLKIWPQWDEFDQITHETRCMDDHEEFERMLDIEYTSLKEYLATMLKATKPFAKEAQELKRCREISESSKSVPGDVDGEMENDDEDKPLLELMKHLINSEQNIKLTNSQLIDILKKEFGLDHANLHFISVDIYMNVLKNFLKIWPHWDEFEQIMHETRRMDDHEEFERMLDIEYTSLKEYLATMLKATKPFAKEAQKLKRSREIPESSKSVPGDVDGEMENDDEDKPLLELMKHLINSKQKIKITNSQLIDILKKEFGLDHANLHFISVDIYMNVLKKFLKIWPQWDEFDQIMHETRCMDDHEEFERMLDIEYTSLKEYLATMLKATKPFAKEAQKLKRSREIPESSKSVPGDLVLEINCTREQLNTLFFRKPHPKYNGTIFNINTSLPSNISLNQQSFQSMLNSCYVNIIINMACFKYRREMLPNFKHVLVNKKLRPLKRDPARALNPHLQSCKDMKTQSEVSRKDLKYVIDKIKKSNRYSLDQQFDVDTIFKVISEDFNVLPASFNNGRIELPCTFRFYLSKYPYLRHLYEEVENDSEKYDLQLEEKISPMLWFNIARLSLVSKFVNTDSNWLRLECSICQTKYHGVQGIEALKSHFREAHQNEPNWSCSHCDKEFVATELATARWHHKCDNNQDTEHRLFENQILKGQVTHGQAPPPHFLQGTVTMGQHAPAASLTTSAITLKQKEMRQRNPKCSGFVFSY